MTRFTTAGTLSFALGLAGAALPSLAAEPAPASDYPIQPVPFTQTEIADAFWAPRISKNREVTVGHNLQKCELTGRIQNFVVAARKADGGFQGVFGFDDSDVYKVIEGAAYTLGLQRDPELDRRIDDVIAKIAAAQEPDGYLYTVGQIGKTAEKPICCVGMTRWVDERNSHELYNAGHLFEAAVAHYEATGKRNLLDVATKNADLLTRVFGPGKNMLVPGHEEVEIGVQFVEVESNLGLSRERESVGQLAAGLVEFRAAVCIHVTGEARGRAVDGGATRELGCRPTFEGREEPRGAGPSLRGPLLVEERIGAGSQCHRRRHHDRSE